ncbi:DnaJ family domain-containing protein [Promicromonospora kroppenstedtii]|uniref:DnaJ family domain-containing protein n=1 Tax=Promicromonospora kroppenstedtii TaxID=440482 RepID=A0ABW7XIY8_9MICO
MAPGSRDDADNDPLRRAAQYRVDREAEAERAEQPATPGDAGDADAEPAEDGADEGRRPGAMSVEERSRYVDVVIDQAMRRGEFDNLPLHGKPIPGIGGKHDPDWWVKGLIERENITGVLPSAQLRKDDAELDARLDLEAMEERVREIVAEFNARVVDARRQLQGGPPIVTPTRDVDEQVRRWQERRAARRAATSVPAPRRGPGTSAGRPWWKFW